MFASNITPSSFTTQDTHTSGPTPVGILLASLLTIIIAASGTGNVFVIVNVFSDRRMQTPTNMFIVSQSIADLCTTILVLPFAIVSALKSGWIFGETFCAINGFFNMYFIVITILNLTVIAHDRFLAIVKSSHHRINKNTARNIIALVWVVALVPGIPLLALFSDKVRMKYYHSFLICGQEFLEPVGRLELGILITFCFIFVVVPLVIISYVFDKILRVIHGNRQRVCPSALTNAQKIAVEVYAKSAHTSMGVIITSLIQVFPACIALLLGGFQSVSVPRGFATTSKVIMWCHCIVKPVIYIVRQRAWSKKLSKLFAFFKGESKFQPWLTEQIRSAFAAGFNKKTGTSVQSLRSAGTVVEAGTSKIRTHDREQDVHVTERPLTIVNNNNVSLIYSNNPTALRFAGKPRDLNTQNTNRRQRCAEDKKVQDVRKDSGYKHEATGPPSRRRPPKLSGLPVAWSMSGDIKFGDIDFDFH